MSTIKLRWRIVDGKLSLRERHLRSLEPLDLTPPLRAWIRSRLEWAVDNLLTKETNEVLCLTINPLEDVVISLEPLRARPHLSCVDLLYSGGYVSGIEYQDERITGTVWLEHSGAVYASALDLTTAVDTLARDLITTLGERLIVAPIAQSTIDAAQAIFVLSDEFGMLPVELDSERDWATEAPLTAKLTECFARVYPALL